MTQDTTIQRDLKQLVEAGTIKKDVAAKYLTIYMGEADWPQHINSLYNSLNERYAGDKEAVSLEMRRHISCAILLPTTDKSIVPDPAKPERLLFGVRKFDVYNKQDWFAELRKTVARDLEISSWRSQVMSLGYIDPIELQPYCRQGFNWMYGKAEESNAITPQNKEELTKKFTRIIWAYGGAVVSNMFINHSEAANKVLNWRSGYFFERAIFDVYTLEQVLKIKKTELHKTSQKLVRTFRID